MATNLKNLSTYNPEDIPSGEDFKIAIITSEWNSQITNALFEGAYSSLLQHNVKAENIAVKYVPGSFELTSGANMALKNQQFDAVICLGCIIQGETRHFDFICQAVANGINDVSLKYNTPIIFGVLTTNDLQQAIDRSGGKHGNKGVEAAITALKMAAFK